MNLKLRQLVVFLILMQGVENKAPSYVLEKFQAATMSNEPEALLDYINMERLLNYVETWQASEYSQEQLDAMRREIKAGHDYFDTEAVNV